MSPSKLLGSELHLNRIAGLLESVCQHMAGLFSSLVAAYLGKDAKMRQRTTQNLQGQDKTGR